MANCRTALNGIGFFIRNELSNEFENKNKQKPEIIEIQINNDEIVLLNAEHVIKIKG